MGLKAVAQQSVSSLGALPVQTPASPRSLLAKVQAIASPVVLISPRSAFTDTARSTPATDGSLVAGAQDLAGNGFVATQATSAKRPNLRIAALNNSFPAFDFTSAVTQSLQSVNAFTATGMSAGYTVYIVATGGIINNSTNVLDCLVTFTNGDYIGLRRTGGVVNNALEGGFNSGATPLANNSVASGLDVTGVYVTAYDGVTATVGLNGRYNSSSITGTVPTTGDLFVGDFKATSLNWSLGVIGDVWLFPGKHTQAQMDAISQLLNNDAGIVLPTWLFVGDSITRGFGLTTIPVMNYASQLCAQMGANIEPLTATNTQGSNIYYLNVGTDSETLAGMITDVTTAPYTRTGFVSSARGSQNVAFIFGGTNDMATAGDGQSAAVAFSRLQTLCALYKATGAKIVVGTALPRSSANAGVDFETKRLAFNALIRSAGTSLYDILMDFAADPRIGAVGALGTSVFQADNIHPSEQGAAILAEVAALALTNGYSTSPILNTIPVPKVIPKILKGTTAGVLTWAMPKQSSSEKKFVGYFSGYENNTAVNQTVTFPTPFINTPVIVGNDSSLTISASTTTLTITAPNNTTLFTGNIIVEGF